MKSNINLKDKLLIQIEILEEIDRENIEAADNNFSHSFERIRTKINQLKNQLNNTREVVNLSDDLLLVFIQEDDANDFYINDVGCIRYCHDSGRQNSAIIPEKLGFYATKDNCLVRLLSKGLIEDGDEDLKPLLLHNHVDIYDYTRKFLLVKKIR